MLKFGLFETLLCTIPLLAALVTALVLVIVAIRRRN